MFGLGQGVVVFIHNGLGGGSVGNGLLHFAQIQTRAPGRLSHVFAFVPIARTSKNKG